MLKTPYKTDLPLTHALINTTTLNVSHGSQFDEMHMIQISPFLAFLVAVNTVSLVLFGVDKLKSMSGGWRIPETDFS